MAGKLDIIGHAQVLSVLDRAVVDGRLRHAYLFLGAARVGKATVARWLAARLNCPNDPAPCGRCPSCLRIQRGVHPDIRSLQIPGDRDESLGLPLESLEKVSRVAERSIGIEQVRALQHDAALASREAAWKVYQILNAELLTMPAANCLLKTLEEPPPNVVLILTVSDGADLLPTLISRCQIVRFGLVSTEEIRSGLRTAFGVDAERADIVARLAGGRPGVGDRGRVRRGPVARARSRLRRSGRGDAPGLSGAPGRGGKNGIRLLEGSGRGPTNDFALAVLVVGRPFGPARLSGADREC